MKTKIVGLADCDSFYASCERVFRPDWARKPIVVLSNNDGCVVARSAEAKALGIPMGEPYFRLKSFAEARGVVVRSANFALYGDLSRRVMRTLERWTPSLDVYSIDEAFLDLSGLAVDDAEDSQREPPDMFEERRRVAAWPDGSVLGEISDATRARVEKTAREIAETVYRWTGVPVSLGFGPTRTLAKAASRLAKDERARSGKRYALMFGKEERIAGLKRLAIGDVWGVGRKLRDAFEKSGLKTAYDLARCDPTFVRKSYTIDQERTVRELRGEMIYDAVSQPKARQTMRISRSFGEGLCDVDELAKPISTFATRLAAKLRERKLVAGGLCVFLETSRFARPEALLRAGMATNFARPTNLTGEMLATALQLTRRAFVRGYEYKRAGVVAVDLIDEEVASRRRWLFDPTPERTPEVRERDLKISRALDAIGAKFGQNAVFFASEGVERAWSPGASMVSPCYTTDWNALPTAR